MGMTQSDQEIREDLSHVPMLERSIYWRKSKRLAEERKGKERKLAFTSYFRAISVIVAITMVFTVVKCALRLFQVTPFVNSPPSVWFWTTVLAGPMWAIAMVCVLLTLLTSTGKLQTWIVCACRYSVYTGAVYGDRYIHVCEGTDVYFLLSRTMLSPIGWVR